MIRTILFMLILFMAFFFMINNKDQIIQVQFYMGKSSPPIPLYLMILGTFLAGLMVAVVFIFPSWLKLKLESRRQKKEIDSLEEKVGQLRNQAFQPSVAPSPPQSPEPF